jgi:hypothetical protein
VDFTGKAERRGVQRAAVELALNLLASNLEQHRPHDKFRRVKLPPAYKSPPKEVPLWLPLEPWKRPVELDTFKYTKVMRKYREWKDEDYEIARTHAIDAIPDSVPTPENFAGPHTQISEDGLAEFFKQRQREQVELQADLFEAAKTAPRPLLHLLNILIDESCRISSRDGDDEHLQVSYLTEREINVLRELTEPSWYENIINYPDSLTTLRALGPEGKVRLSDFEHDLQRIMNEIPFWQNDSGESGPPDFLQDKYDPSLPSVTPNGNDQGWILYKNRPDNRHARDDSHGQPMAYGGLLMRLNDKRVEHAEAMGIDTYSIGQGWTREEAKAFLRTMHLHNRIL